MTQAPTPGPLTVESVKLLVKGDLLRGPDGGVFKFDRPYEAVDYHDRNGVYLHRADGTEFVLKDGSGPKSQWFVNLTFIGRPDADGEVWTPVARHPRWKASTSGRVMGPRGEVHGNPTPRGGYPTVRIGERPSKGTYHKHRLVTEAFLGPKPEGVHVAHADGNPLNNALSNLSYVTPRENHSHKALHGTQQRGESVAGSLLTEAQVRQIKAGELGRKASEIAHHFGVARRTITDIFNGKTWRHVDV